MDVLHCAMTMNYSKTGIKATEISDHFVRAAGAMAMIFGWIDLDSIRMMGHWYIGYIMRFLHIQAQPIINNCYAMVYTG
jgi:hypothetical protein